MQRKEQDHIRNQIEFEPNRPQDLQVEVNPEVCPSYDKTSKGDRLGNFTLHVVEELRELENAQNISRSSQSKRGGGLTARAESGKSILK